MSIRNKVQLVGHLGASPELRTLENGAKVASFRVATNENYKDKNGNWQSTTTWHNVVAWEGLAQRADSQLEKGSYIMLEGKLTNRDYTNKEGVKKFITEIRTESFILLNKSNNSSSAMEEITTYNQKKEFDDLPF